jgi:hypothetical protein
LADRRVGKPRWSLSLSLASALNVLRSTLPYYLVLTKYNLLHLDATTFEFRPCLPALLIALELPSASPDLPVVALTRDGNP